MANSFPTVPAPPSVWSVEWARQVFNVIGGLVGGKMNVTGTLTLTANAGSTTLNDTRIGGSSAILLMPTTANAAAALATTYIGTVGQRTATVTHANTATTDRTFVYVVVG